MDHLKKWWALHATWVLALAAVIAQVSDHYFTMHPKATLGGLFGAIGWAAVTFVMKSPAQQ